MNLLADQYTLDGKTYKITWIPGDSYKGLEPITQAYGFCFDQNNKLLVQTHDDNHNWQVMGGTVEPGEKPEETLVREVDEETNVDIDSASIVYLGAQKVEDEEGKVYYQLRFAARIIKLKARKPDPARGVIRPRKLIDPSDYDKVSDWGEIGTAITERAMEKLGISAKIR